MFLLQNHAHLAWGLTAANTFATADECAYNANLSAHWADAVAAQAIESGMHSPPVQLSDIQEDDTMVRPYLNRAAAGLQPRGNRLPPLLTDFFIHETVSLETQPWLRELYPGKRLPPNEQFPPGARILSFANDYVGGDVVGEKVTVGVPLDPLSYLQQACNAEHPSERCMVVDDHTERAVQILMSGDPLDSRRLRISEARVLIELVKQCADDDKVPAHLQKVMKGKKWTAFNAALLRVGYADASIALEAMNGFPLAGWLPTTSVFPTLVKPPEMHVNELATLTSSYAARALASVKTLRMSNCPVSFGILRWTRLKLASLRALSVERFLQRNSILFPHATSVCVLLFCLTFGLKNQINTKHKPQHTHTHTCSFLIPVKFPFKGRVGRDSSVF